MNYSTTFQVGKKDNERYNLYSMKRKTIIMSMMVFVVITGMVTVVQLNSGIIFNYALLIGIGLGLAGIIFFIVVNFAFVKYNLYSFYKNGRIKPFKQNILMNEEGLHATTENGSVDIPFQQIGGVDETKHAFYISITKEHTYVFPKDQMKGEIEFQTVRNILRANMPGVKLKLQT
jgi:hypothetical protein